MQIMRKEFAIILLVCMAITATPLFAQQQRMTIQASARGTSTQMGRLASVNIIIEQLSTAEDQKVLIEAFTKGGHDNMMDALKRMKPKGRLAITGTLGGDVVYIRELPSEKGRRFRLLTDRYIRFMEERNDPRSRDYDLTAVELTILPNGGGAGVLMPACRLKLSKNKQIEVEVFQNPWNLTDVVVR